MKRTATIIIVLIMMSIMLSFAQSWAETVTKRGTDGNVYNCITTYDTNTGAVASYVEVKVKTPAALKDEAAQLRAKADAIDAQADSLAIVLAEPAPKAAQDYVFTVTVAPKVVPVVLDELEAK